MTRIKTCRNGLVWLIFATALATPPASGAETDERPAPHAGPVEAELLGTDSGWLVDRTITFVGREFYRAFVDAWREQHGREEHDLMVVEFPSARSGSLVRVEFKGSVLFRAFLFPGRRMDIRALGAQAAELIARRLGNIDIEELIFRDPDLAKDEF